MEQHTFCMKIINFCFTVFLSFRATVDTPEIDDDTVLAFADKTGDDTGIRPVDVNGDLIPDLIVWRKNADGSELREAFLNRSKRRDILLSVTNGMGFQIAFNHDAGDKSRDIKNIYITI